MGPFMKTWNLLPLTLRKRLNQRGQSIVEFVLLLAVISLISYTFVAVMNKNLARYWQYSANLIVDDKPGTKSVQFR
jgi:hypothetical protein